MAKKKAVVRPVRTQQSRDNEKLIERVRRRYRIMVDADQENRRASLDDLKFAHVPGKQWEENQKKERGDRPCYEYNKLRITIKRIVNDIRANRPAGKVRAVEDGDVDTADVIEGLIRNIWNVSDGDTTVDYAAEYQVGGGMGAWRVNTKYSSDTVFDQDIVIEPFKNPFCLYADPSASDPLKRDADDWCVTEKISSSSFKARWPGIKPESFDETEFDDDLDWQDGEQTRICEYWWKEPATKTLLLLADGKTVEADKYDGPEASIVRRREIRCHKIMMCIVGGGDTLLTPPTEWAGSMFPFIQIYGEWLTIEGKVYWFGITRFAKDAQRSYNVSRTAITETIAAAPQSKFWATPEQAKGHTEDWAIAHKELMPFQLYNPDPKQPGPPQRMGGAEVPVALIQESQLASDEIKAVTGIFDASLGGQGNEVSGRAITARQHQGEIATFNYRDNAAKGVRRTYEILIDLIPRVYDTARSVRILGVDGAEKYVKINSQQQDPKTGQMVAVNDLTRGKYDVTVTAGPSFATRRMEASETYVGLSQSDPTLMQIAGDLVFKSLDLPYSEEIAERKRLMLPPQIQQSLSQDKPIPPEVQAAMAQADQAMKMVQEQGQLVQAAAQEVEQNKAQAEKVQADVKTAMAQLDTKKAQMEAWVAKQLSMLAEKEIALQQREMQAQNQEERASLAAEREALAAEGQQAAANIQQIANQFTQLAQQAMAEINRKEQELGARVDQEIAMLMQSQPVETGVV